MFNQGLIEPNQENGNFHWIVRFKLNDDDSSLLTYNETIESILIIGETPCFTIEYAKNKLITTTKSPHLLLIDNWEKVKVVQDPMT